MMQQTLAATLALGLLAMTALAQPARPLMSGAPVPVDQRVLFADTGFYSVPKTH